MMDTFFTGKRPASSNFSRLVDATGVCLLGMTYSCGSGSYACPLGYRSRNAMRTMVMMLLHFVVSYYNP
jgi:hypothetical protein